MEALVEMLRNYKRYSEEDRVTGEGVGRGGVALTLY